MFGDIMNFDDIFNGAMLIVFTLSAESWIDRAFIPYYALAALGFMFIVNGLSDSSPGKIKQMEQEIRELKLVASNSHRTLRGMNNQQDTQGFTPEPIVSTTGKICTVGGMEHSESYVRCTNCGGILQR